MANPRSLGLRIVSIILFVVVIVGTIFYVLPLNKKYEALFAENTVEKAKLVEHQKQLKELQDIQKTLGKTAESQEGVKQLLAVVPQNIDQSGLIEDFHKIAESQNIIYSTLSFGKQRSAAEGVSVVTVNASFEGDYDDLRSFLKALEVNNRKLIVKNLGVQIGDTVEVEIENPETQETELVKKQNAVFVLTIEAYYQS